MSHRFAEIAFTQSVRLVQEEMGSRGAYARLETGAQVRNHRLAEAEAAFIGERDSFYMASVGETGWPYLQHRGGAKGFVRVIDAGTIGFADYRGNRQYVSVGNLRGDDRVFLFFMDYARKARLKLLGRARSVAPEEWEGLAKAPLAEENGRTERGIVIAVEAFDWNCPQFITERYTMAEVRQLSEGLLARIAELEAELARDRSGEDRAGEYSS